MHSAFSAIAERLVVLGGDAKCRRGCTSGRSSVERRIYRRQAVSTQSAVVPEYSHIDIQQKNRRPESTKQGR